MRRKPSPHNGAVDDCSSIQFYCVTTRRRRIIDQGEIGPIGTPAQLQEGRSGLLSLMLLPMIVRGPQPLQRPSA